MPYVFNAAVRVIVIEDNDGEHDSLFDRYV